MVKSKKAHSKGDSIQPLESLPRSVEQKLAGSFAHVIGIDEAGRGPLAGPVVAAACIVESGVSIEGIIDSKQTKEEDREKTFEVLMRHPSVTFGVSVVSHTEIDEVNILQATMNAMTRACNDLLSKLSKGKSGVSTDCIALIDGNRIPTDIPVEAKYVIKGDGSIFSIAAASIIAKVTRDRIMVDLDKKYPLYNLAQHKGYPTFEHRSLLLQHGASDIHRLTFGPVKKALEVHGKKLDAPEVRKAVAVSTTRPKAIKSKANVVSKSSAHDKSRILSKTTKRKVDQDVSKPTATRKSPRLN